MMSKDLVGLETLLSIGGVECGVRVSRTADNEFPFITRLVESFAILHSRRIKMKRRCPCKKRARPDVHALKCCLSLHRQCY